MTGYARDGSTWQDGVVRAYDGSAWTAEGDNGYVWDGTEWVLFQPYASSLLEKPTNLVATPGDIDASFTWTNPTQTLTPTHIQVRIPETTSVWTELVYPDTSFDVSYLTASTNYQMQIRYIIRTDGSITATGPIAEVFFTTTAPTGPGTPAEDPGGTGGDSIVNWPNTVGTPGVVGGADCWWEYVIQEFDPDTYIISDSAVTAEIDGDIGDYQIDFLTLGFTCGQSLRFKYREVCNGVPEAWEYGLFFTVMCDYADPCGGVNQTRAFSETTWADAVLAMPKICYEDARTKIEDFVTTTVEYGRLSAYHLPLYLENAWELRALDGLSVYGEPLVAGNIPGLVPIGSAVPALTSDFSYTMGVFADEQPSAGSGAPVKIAEISGTVSVYMYAEGAGVRFSVGFPMEGGGTFDLAGTTEHALGAWHVIAVTIDQDGDKILYVDGVAEVTDADTTRADFGSFTDDLALYANDQMRVRKVGVWDRVLTPTEVLSLDAISTYAWSVERLFGGGTIYSGGSSTIAYEQAMRSWYMPEVEGEMTVIVQGSAGEPVFGTPTTGVGARIVGSTDNTRIPVATELKLEVGAYSTSNVRTDKSPGGGGNGNNSDAGGGGGATYLSKSPFAEPDRVIVAGGGGGETWGSSGTDGGDAGLTTGTAQDGGRNVGSGATTSAGGTGGAGGNGNAEDGVQGLGGACDDSATNDGGGGGGGWYGGGGGGGAGSGSEGGGGGSSYIDATLMTLESEALAASAELGRIGFNFTQQFRPGLLEIFRKIPKAVWGFTDPIMTDDRKIVEMTGNFAGAADLQVHQFGGYSAESSIIGCRQALAPDNEAYLAVSVSSGNFNASGVSLTAEIPFTGIGNGYEAQTIICFFRGNTFPAVNGFYEFSYGTNGSNTDYRVRTTAAGTITAEIGSVTHTTVALYDDNLWHMVALTHDTNGAAVIYIDGVSVATGTATTAAVADPRMWLWGEYATERVPTDCDQGPIAVYDKKLTGAQILEIWEAFMAL